MNICINQDLYCTQKIQDLFPKKNKRKSEPMYSDLLKIIGKFRVLANNLSITIYDIDQDLYIFGWVT